MNKNVKIIGSVIGILGAIIWIVGAFKANELGATGNNGYSNDLPPMMKPDLQKKIEDKMRDPANRPNFAEMGNPQSMEAASKKFEEGFTPEEREEMKKMREEMKTRMERARAALSQEEQQQLRQKMMEMMRNGGGPFGGRGGRRGGGGGRPSGEGQSQ